MAFGNTDPAVHHRAMVGALLVADGIRALRTLGAFVEGIGKGKRRA